MSLQRRVALAMAGVVALFVAVLGALAFLAVEAEEDALVDEIVQAEAQRLAQLAARGQLLRLDAEALREPGPGLSVWLVEADGRTVPEPLPARLQGLADGVHRLGNPAEHLHVVATSTPVGRLVVQYDAARNEARVHEFGLYLAGLSLLCIGLGAVVARQVARLVVAPIEQLVTRLDAWAPDGSLAASGGSDEESRLLDTFGRVQARLEQAMAHEREFVANLAHEIRTPLSALRTDLEMLQAGSDSDRPIRLARSLAAVDAVAEALAAARAIQQRVPLAPRPTALAQCVDDAWGSLGTLAQQHGLRLVNLVPPQASASVDRHSLLTILRNLLRNAAEHAAPATCTVRGDGAGLEIVDDGPGIAQADLPFLFDRYWSGRLVDARAAAPRLSAGIVPPAAGEPPDHGEPAEPGADRRGLGLAIAKQVADLNGWQLTARSAAGRGTRFTLVFADTPHAAAAKAASH